MFLRHGSWRFHVLGCARTMRDARAETQIQFHSQLRERYSGGLRFFGFILALRFSLFSSVIRVTFNSVNESMSVLMVEHVSQLSYITDNLTSWILERYLYLCTLLILFRLPPSLITSSGFLLLVSKAKQPALCSVVFWAALRPCDREMSEPSCGCGTRLHPCFPCRCSRGASRTTPSQYCLRKSI